MLLLLSLLLSLIFQICNSTTILVDGVSEWKNPTVHVGDSIIFKHKYHYNLYIFQNQRAFNLCNFTQASLLTKPNSISYTWHPSRTGFYYFTFNNGSLKSCNQDSLKLSIKVSPPQPPVELSPAAAPIPAPISGGEVSSSPAYPWPFRPREEASSPAPVPSSVGASSPMTVPTVIPSDKGGGSSMPFINSNPAVPLPTGEVDSATIRPLPASGHHQQVPLSYHTHCEKRGEKKNERKKFLLI
ncbi:zyxin isoform X1 [Jatropha curcas]|uniref:zyxin isoform X1 n=1 Tax=Jatropha curcas TaxID=180498 RepID=UPI001895479A|nr:zyxin isoform X1 [Jatropha curcas]